VANDPRVANGPWCGQYFDARIRSDTPALQRLAQQPQALAQHPAILYTVATHVSGSGRRETAIELLRKAQRRYPADYMINSALASYLQNKTSSPRFVVPHHTPEALRYVEESVSFHRAALAALPPEYANSSSGDMLASALLASGRPEEAVAVLQEGIRREPTAHTTAHTYALLGEVLYATGNHDGATAAYLQAVKLGSDDILAYSFLANALRVRGEWKEAISVCRKAVEVCPEGAEFYLNLGRALLHDNDDPATDDLAALRKALELYPQRWAAHQALGSALRSQGDLLEASAAYRKVIELKPGVLYHYNDLVNVLSQKGDLDGLIATLREMDNIQPNTLDEALADALRARGDWKEAIASYRQAIDRNPKNFAAYRGLGRALLHEKDNSSKGEVAAFRKALELYPRAPTAYFSLGDALRGQGDWDGALAVYRKILEFDGDDFQAHLYVAACLQAKGSLDEAIAAFRSLVERAPAEFHSSGYSGLGQTFRQKGDLKAASDAFRKVTEIDPKDSWAHLELANTLSSRGDLEGAAVVYRKIIDLVPSSDWGYHGLGKALLHEKHDSLKVDNLAALRKAVEAYPSAPWAHFYLGRLLQGKGE
jgi:tetratricopeptide (TPR) repeat protein